MPPHLFVCCTQIEIPSVYFAWLMPLVMISNSMKQYSSLIKQYIIE